MLSVVVPVLNEEEVIELFFKELTKHLLRLDGNYEIIFIDDGSTDKSLDILQKITSKNSSVKIFSFRKHRGKSEALTLGFKKAAGDLVLTIDADLQDKPDQIEKLMNKEKEGWDLVSGWRKNRSDSIFKKVSSNFFNSISSIFWSFKINDLNSGLKLYSSEAAKSLNLYGGMHRFIPLLLHQEGFSVAEIAVEHQKRKLGKSKYNFTKVFTELPDMFTMLFLTKYGKRPLHFFALVGAILFFIGIAVLIYLTFLRIEGYSIGRRPLLFLGMLLVISGLQIFFTGFIADLFINSSNEKATEETIFKYRSDK